MGVPRLGVRTRLRRCLRSAGDVGYRVRVRRLGRDTSHAYRDYLDVQLRRTLSKRANDPGVGLRVLIGEAVARARPAPGASILCVGCRNGVELDEFRARGFEDVVGIDLFSQRHDIRVMDMHELAFAESSFDVIYASHSLEHSYDLQRVVHELARVARDGAVVAVEVPVGGRASEADRIEFAGVDQLRETFSAHLRDEL